MLEIRFHGRGGQGVVLAGILLAKAFFRAGYYVQSFPLFGVERRGAPVEAYLRVDREEILIRTNSYTPDHVVVLDTTLLEGIDVTRGLKPAGWILLNTGAPPADCARFSGYRLAYVDATEIALRHELGTHTYPIVNTAMMGAFARVLGAPPMAAVAGAIVEEIPETPEANIEAAREAYERVRRRRVAADGSAMPLTPLPAVAAGSPAGGSGILGIDDIGCGGTPPAAEGSGSSGTAIPAAATRRPLLVPLSFRTSEGNKTGSWRFLRPRYDEKTAPCSAACPAGEDIGRIEMLAARGLFEEAWETILRENPLPAVCGRLCFHPCEKKCNRREFDEGIGIHIIERFLGDNGARYELTPSLERLEAGNRKVAVLGAGPVGLSAAYFLGRLGYGCDVFESDPEPGGELRYGTPASRLPVAVLRAEIEQIRRAGFNLYCGKPVTKGFVEEIRGGYDGVFLAPGRSRDVKLPVTGEEAGGEWHDPPLEQEGGLRLSNSVIVFGSPVFVYGGELVSRIKSVAHEVASGKEAAMALDIFFQKGPDGVLPGIETCRVGNGPALSMEVYMQGPRSLRNRHIVAFSEINTDRFQLAPRVVQPQLPREERAESPAEIDLRISADPVIKEAERCFNCGLCNQCDNCRLYCPELAVVGENDSGARRIDYDYCKGCGICVAECPRNAMSLDKEGQPPGPVTDRAPGWILAGEARDEKGPRRKP